MDLIFFAPILPERIRISKIDEESHQRKHTNARGLTGPAMVLEELNVSKLYLFRILELRNFVFRGKYKNRPHSFSENLKNCQKTLESVFFWSPPTQKSHNTKHSELGSPDLHIADIKNNQTAHFLFSWESRQWFFILLQNGLQTCQKVQKQVAHCSGTPNKLTVRGRTPRCSDLQYRHFHGFARIVPLQNGRNVGQDVRIVFFKKYYAKLTY